MAKKDEISIKGLDSLSKAFLASDPASKDVEYVAVQKGQQLKPEHLQRYEDEKKKEFIQRSGRFTEDLVAFIVQQRRARELSDTEAIFGIALANINLRDSFGMPQEGEKTPTEQERTRLFDQFDAICFAAQEYYDANT